MSRKKKHWFDSGMIIMVCIAVVGLGVGCAAMTGLFGGAESPRPKEFQVEASKEITITNTETIMESQLGKQEGIEAIALAALKAIGASRTDKQMEAITNVVANTAASLERTKGVEAQLAKMSTNASEGMTSMDMLNYMAYAGSQTAVAMNNREEAYKGIKSGFQWTSKAITGIAGGSLGGVGLLGLLMGYMRKNGQKSNALNMVKSALDAPELAKIKKAAEFTGMEKLVA